MKTDPPHVVVGGKLSRSARERDATLTRYVIEEGQWSRRQEYGCASQGLRRGLGAIH